MLSIRTKTTFLNVIAITVAVVVVSIIGVISSAKFGHSSSEQALALLCESGKNNLNYYFKSVEQSVNTIASLINADLDTITDFNNEFASHVQRAENVFTTSAYNTNGVFDYYYRMDPDVTDATGEKGFWYIDESDTDEPNFVSHTVTEIDGTNECLWFYETKDAGHPIWLPPYITDTIGAYVISYNVPVYRNTTEFIGVVGIEIDYAALGKQIKDIKIHRSGYAFIVDSETGSIIYHPKIDLSGVAEEDRPVAPSGLKNGLKNNNNHVQYVYNGVEKHAYWLSLSNNMAIVVAVPFSEINETWQSIIIKVAIATIVVVGVFIAITILFTRQITKPLKQLTLAAEEIDKGNYEVKLESKGNDEIAVLTKTMDKLVKHLGEYITDLNSLAYVDALTNVSNRGSFDMKLKEIQNRMEHFSPIYFAIAIFDCDDLKEINDKYGHDKGNIYLRNSSNLICRVFKNSEVYRIGGDEFAIILEGEDYDNREALQHYFLRKSAEITAFTKEEWEQIRVSVGIAAYDPDLDITAEDVMIRADHLMYDNKRQRKNNK